MTEKTIVQVIFEGPDSDAAADAYVVQFADGGMDEDVEARLAGQGYTVEDTDFDTSARTLTIKLGTGDA
ncbi:hypothetical protein JANAI62_11660 [Jannaschia pagri]|uniref:Uncharacterized protein n=1 Tax=Jannaschia pagri TaxID=2829797 RepID=A0ABQ4NJF2_9RHOB|nr:MULTISPECIES: hypothetical protein [unclassified Jannaschia]GIT90711.1 hypothetical protein JANAI61_11690 [Jannaschia sp. AI_61]GIT94543.1 hypothetical protein JANAI62_11660 [Jannaschia sp. AI_62]